MSCSAFYIFLEKEQNHAVIVIIKFGTEPFFRAYFRLGLVRGKSVKQFYGFCREKMSWAK